MHIVDERSLVACPFGSVGDRLWVRETFKTIPSTAYGFDRTRYPNCWQVINPSDTREAAIFKEGWDRCTTGAWKPSIHMPRWASRITLEITDVRVQRLQEISEEDAKAEGFEAGHMCEPPASSHHNQATDNFRETWNGIYGTWEQNPWVWVITFKRVDQGEVRHAAN